MSERLAHCCGHVAGLRLLECPLLPEASSLPPPTSLINWAAGVVVVAGPFFLCRALTHAERGAQRTRAPGGDGSISVVKWRCWLGCWLASSRWLL